MCPAARALTSYARSWKCRAATATWTARRAPSARKRIGPPMAVMGITSPSRASRMWWRRWWGWSTSEHPPPIERHEMSRTLIALSLFSGTLSLSAQWEALPAPIIDIFSIQALDAQTLRAGGNGSLLLSDDGGDSWDTTHITFLGTEFPGLLYDVYFTSTTNGFAVGAFSSNQALVLHTTDGGQDWSPAYFDEVGTAPLTTEAIAFPTSSVGIVVGSSGKVLRSTTSGSSWALVASGTTSRLYDVEFTS